MAGDEPCEVRRAAAIIPVKFEFVAPATLDEAIGILAANAGASVVAGGQSLIPAMTLRRAAPSVLVDIGGIEDLRGISTGDGAAGIRIGATTTLAEVSASDGVRTKFTALAEAADAAGDAQVRNRGTIGGSLADGHPAGDVIAVAIALDGVVGIAGPKGARQVPAAAFVTGRYGTVLRAGEIITSLEIPGTAGAGGSAYIKERHPGSGYAIVGVAAALTVAKGGVVGAIRLAATGAAGHPGRLDAAEAAAAGKTVRAAAEAAEAAVAGSRHRFASDLAASAAYRKHLAGVLAGRAIRLAGQRGGEA